MSLARPFKAGAAERDEYRGIGVRIEDDVLVTADGYRVLTDKAPKQVAEIEELMTEGRRK